MWNYSYVLPSAMVFAILLAHYFMSPRLNIRQNRTFLALLAVNVLTLAADLASTRVDEYFTTYPTPWLYALNTLFFACYLARAYGFFLFTLDVLRTADAPVKLRRAVYGAVFYVGEAIVLTSAATGAVFRIDDMLGYQAGPLYKAVMYGCWLFYIALGLFLLDRNAARLDHHSFVCALAFHIVLFVGNIVRFLLPRYLVMNTFCLLAILIIYLAFENPDLYLANRRIAFSLRAFRAEMEECVGKRPYRVLAFVIQDYADTREIYGGIQMDRGVDMIADFLTSAYPECQIFYLRNGCFALLGGEQMPWEDMRSYIAKRFQAPWRADDAELFLDAAFVQLGSETQMESAEKAVNTIVDAIKYAAQASGSLIDLNEGLEFAHQTDIKRALGRALEYNAVEIFLQPIVESASRALVGAEALARLRDADGRIIPPSLFVPVAEKNGKISLMGEQVLEKACRFIRENDLTAMGLTWVNIDLSPIQCMRRDLSERFMAILEANDVPPEKIRLEIGERAVVDVPLLEEHVQTLHEKGFQFSLDDFGSGSSHLSRIKHYPFSNIKLDMELVLDYFHEQDQMLPNIVRAFREMGYTVTAEGIETEEMADAMAAVGCDYLQGFCFSKPLPVDEFVQKYAGKQGKTEKREE